MPKMYANICSYPDVHKKKRGIYNNFLQNYSLFQVYKKSKIPAYTPSSTTYTYITLEM